MENILLKFLKPQGRVCKAYDFLSLIGAQISRRDTRYIEREYLTGKIVAAREQIRI